MINGSSLIVEILEKNNISKVFGNPGTTEKPFIKDINNSDIDYILSLHEDIALSAATGYSMKMKDYFNDNKVKNPISVVNLHSTPGLLHSLGNLYNSDYNDVPLLITTGSQDINYEEKKPILSGNREHYVKNLTKYSRRINDAKNIPYVFERALKTALSPPMGAVFVDIPLPVQKQSISEPDIPIINTDTKSNSSLTNNSIDDICKMIKDNKNTTIFVGGTISGEDTISSIVNLSEKIGCPVYGEVYLEKATFPTDHPQWVGVPSVREDPYRMADEGTIIEIGCSSNLTLLEEESKKNLENYDIITISDSYEKVNRLDHTDLPIVGNISNICEKISNQISINDNIRKKNIIRAKVKREKRNEEIKETYDKEDLSRFKLCSVLSKILDKNDIIFDEGVTTGFVFRNVMNREYGNFWGLKGGGLGQGMGSSIGLGIAEQEVGNDRDIYCLIGDGSFEYYPQSLFTVNRHLDLTYNIIIVRNKGYEILKDDNDNKHYTFEQIDEKKICEGYGIKGKVIKDDLKNNLEKMKKSEENEALIIQIN